MKCKCDVWLFCKRFCVCIDMRGDNLENEVGRVRVF